MRVRFALTLVTGVILNSAPAATAPIEEAMREDFVWFSQLGYPDVRAAKLVRVTTPKAISYGDGRFEAQIAYGFVLREEGERFELLAPDLWPFTAVRNPRPESLHHHETIIEEVDFAATAAARFGESPKDAGRNGLSRRFGERLSERGEYFVLAWVADARGLPELAKSLYGLATLFTDPNESILRSSPTFRERLARDLAKSAMWQAVLACGDLRVPRPELAARMRRIERNFPSTEHGRHARAIAELFERMVAEDAEHVVIANEALAKLSPQEQTREWIFRLRDQNGQQWSQPGSCDIFNDFGRPPGAGISPAHRLAELGFAAVPELIAALDDPRLSRSVEYGRDFVFSHRVLTVGDCARAILERIAGRRFEEAMTLFGERKPSVPVRTQIETWWSDVREKGKREVLIAGLASGGNDAARQARLLRASFPDALSAPLVAGIAAARDSWVRSDLIALAGEVGDETCLAALRRELDGPFWVTRLAAAEALHSRGATEDAVRAMIREWRFVPEKAFRGAWERVPGFLTRCDSPDAIDALAEGLRARPVEERSSVVGAVCRTGAWQNWESKRDTPPSAATQQAIERLLVAELEDLEEGDGGNGMRFRSPGLKSNRDARLCDLAAEGLAFLKPKKYRFDITQPLPERERQRIACLNVWRAEHGAPLLPPPITRPPLPEAEANRVVEVALLDAANLSSPEFAEKAHGALHAQLSPGLCMELVQMFATNPPLGSRGLRFKATRDDALGGVVLRLEVLAGGEAGTSWAVQQRVSIDGGWGYQSGGGAVPDAFSGRNCIHEAWGAAIAKALQTPAQSSFNITFDLTWNDARRLP